MRRHALSLFFIVLVAGPGCRTSVDPPPPAPPSPAPAASPAAPPDPVHWVRTAAEYRALALQAFRAAARELEKASAGRAPGTWAVILDADETILDNSLYQKERGNQGFTDDSWTAWVARKEAPPVPGSLAFLARVRELGGRIAVVTNRSAAECPDTQENFRRHAIPFDVMLCKPDPGPSDKNPRFEQVQKGTAAEGLPPLEVLLWIGDNIQDFPALRQDVVRADPEAALAPFGTRYFAIPNPMYGSWERNPPR